MNSKILAALALLAIAAAATSYGTFAFFSDTETSTDNLFTAGDLDLTLDGLNGVTASITGTNFAPGDATSGSILLRNEGSIFTGDAQGHVVDLDFKAVLSAIDDIGNPLDADDGKPSLTGFERYLELTTFSYDGGSLLPQIGDLDGDGWSNTLADLELRGVFANLDDPLAAGKTLEMDVLFRTDAPNHVKRDVVNVEFTFFLAQSLSPDLQPTVILRHAGHANSIPGVTWSSAALTSSPSGEAHLGDWSTFNLSATLTNLPAHSAITVEYDVFVLRSWDGNGVTHGPDLFKAGVDAAMSLDTSFAQAGTGGQCWPSNCPASFPGRTGAYLVNGLGYTFGSGPNDTVYRVTQTIPHTASTAVVWWHGLPNQALADESWGLDNVRVLVH